MVQRRHDEFNSAFLETLAYETPFFLISKKRILHNLKEFHSFFPGASVYYAMKANAEKEVLETLHQADAGFEVASKYELDMLKAIHVPAQKIVYGNSVKPASHIKEFFEYGVDKFAFDSLSELEKIAEAAPGSKVYIRILVSDRGSIFRFSEKFGTQKENALPFLLRARELGLHPYGISFHVGSQASSAKAWGRALKDISGILNRLAAADVLLDVINIGGGYPCNTYLSSTRELLLKEISHYAFLQHKKLPYEPHLVLEPGRAIVADASVLVASVIARVERKKSTWLFLDAGVYSGLFESMVFQGSTRYHITALRKTPGVKTMPFSLAGPTGDSPDVIGRNVMLPRDMNVGDKIVIHDVGAYSLPATCPFNGFPKPDVYFIN